MRIAAGITVGLPSSTRGGASQSSAVACPVSCDHSDEDMRRMSKKIVRMPQSSMICRDRSGKILAAED
jgi:hypothetical protein